MRVLFGYDIMTYNGEIPNCLDPKYLNTIYTASDFDYRFSGEHYQKRWNNSWHLYNSNFWNDYVDKKCVYEFDKNNNLKWFYIVEPFGNIGIFFGNDSDDKKILLNKISSKALNLIKNKNGNLLINYIVDGGLGITKLNFQKIIDFTRGNEIPDEKVYLIFQDFKLAKNLEKLGVKYNILNFNLAYLSKSQEFNNIINNPDFKYWGEKTYEPQFGKVENLQNSILLYNEFESSIGEEKVDFLVMNRHWKLHRLMILSKLHKLNKLFTDNVSWDKNLLSEDAIQAFLFYDKNQEFVDVIRNQSKHLDVSDLSKIAGYGFENKQIYKNSYLSIVTESVFFQHKEEQDIYVDFPTGYLSEKIWKPIGHSHPFILVGPSKSLEYIKSLGYKTFHPYIDESYDLETEDFTRLRMIEKEIERFANKTKEQKDEFLNDVKDIVKYNQELFLNYSKKNEYKNDCIKIIKNLLGQENLELI